MRWMTRRAVSGRYYSHRHRMPFNSRNEGKNAWDDVASNFCRALERGAGATVQFHKLSAAASRVELAKCGEAGGSLISSTQFRVHQGFGIWVLGYPQPEVESTNRVRAYV